MTDVIIGEHQKNLEAKTASIKIQRQDEITLYYSQSHVSRITCCRCCCETRPIETRQPPKTLPKDAWLSYQVNYYSGAGRDGARVLLRRLVIPAAFMLSSL